MSSDVRIILVSTDFGREVTTAILWLNRFDGMDIRCVRLVPYDVDGQVLLDIQQVLPLPETADDQVKLRRKGVARERRHRRRLAADRGRPAPVRPVPRGARGVGRTCRAAWRGKAAHGRQRAQE